MGTSQMDIRGHHGTTADKRKCLGLLHFRKKSVERVTGIEPAWPAWKAGALPLSYTRIS